jgi:hypothetical protein
VYAMADAVTWRGWLCVPSYVVINMDKSSAHLCTWNHIHISNLWGVNNNFNLYTRI